MYDRVLVPIDGSKVAEQVFPYAKSIHQKLGARVEVVRVIEEPPLEPSNPSYNEYLEHLTNTLQSETATYLQELAESLRGDGLPFSWSVKLGNAATLIAQLADEEPSTLILMCSHCRPGLSRWWLGSTTDKVIHAAASPVLVVRTHDQQARLPHAEFKECLVPLDGSLRAEQVLSHVAAWAKGFSLKVKLIRVIPELDSHTLELFPEIGDEDRTGQAKEYLEGVKSRLVDQGISDVELMLEHGHPANVLVDLAHNAYDCLMIMGTQGLGSSGVYRWTMGSVSQRVVGNAQAPVLVVRTEDVNPTKSD